MSRKANPVSSTLAGRAVGLIVENLARAVENPDDPEPREPLPDVPVEDMAMLLELQEAEDLYLIANLELLETLV